MANNSNLLQKWGISLRPRLHRPRAKLPEDLRSHDRTWEQTGIQVQNPKAHWTGQALPGHNRPYRPRKIICMQELLLNVFGGLVLSRGVPRIAIPAAIYRSARAPEHSCKWRPGSQPSYRPPNFWILYGDSYHGSGNDYTMDAAFLLTVGSSLLTVELFYLQLTILAFCLQF